MGMERKIYTSRRNARNKMTWTWAWQFPGFWWGETCLFIIIIFMICNVGGHLWWCFDRIMIVRINYSGQLKAIIIFRKLDDWIQQSELVIREPCLSDLLDIKSSSYKQQTVILVFQSNSNIYRVSIAIRHQEWSTIDYS